MRPYAISHSLTLRFPGTAFRLRSRTVRGYRSIPRLCVSPERCPGLPFRNCFSPSASPYIALSPLRPFDSTSTGSVHRVQELSAGILFPLRSFDFTSTPLKNGFVLLPWSFEQNPLMKLHVFFHSKGMSVL